MARTPATVVDVRAILPAGTGLTDSQITAVIAAASCVVDQVLACAAHITDACLTQIEIYLSAHYGAATELALSRTSEKDPCGGSATYGFAMGEGVKGSPFGQLANTLSGGCLAELDKQPTALFAIGCA